MIRSGFKTAALGALVGLAACEAAPRYSTTLDGAAGAGGVSVMQPRYPINQTPPSQRPAAAPAAAAAPNPDLNSGPDQDAPPRAAPSGRIETETLGQPGAAPAPAPVLRDARPQPAAANPYPPTVQDEDALRGRQTAGPPRLRPAPPPALEIPHDVQVQPFESVYDVAERVRTPLRALIDLNHLRPPYTLAAGTMLKVPPPVIYTVSEADTLFGVARRFSIDPRSLANLNDIPLETRLKAGQRLALPSLVHDKGVNIAARGARPEGLHDPSENLADNPYARPAPPAPPATVRATAKADAGDDRETEASARAQAPPATDGQVIALGKGRFVWPVRGAILSSFGPKGAGQRNDGINIAANTGDSVKAAAAGTVVYAGNSIPAFGNLVLVKHPGGWATLYGNLGKITVKNNAQVSQGQEVGVAGVSGAVDKPQVHFEIRYAQNTHDKAKPYDPASLLPGG